MKNLLNSLGCAIVISVGYFAGGWLWNEVLHEKADKLKERLTKKTE